LKFKSPLDDSDDQEIKVIKGKCEDLFVITSICTQNFHAFSIRPEALFLFQRVERLKIKTRTPKRLSDICSMLDALAIQKKRAIIKSTDSARIENHRQSRARLHAES
jgi:hypothetical protein